MSLTKRGKTWHTHFFVDGRRAIQEIAGYKRLAGGAAERAGTNCRSQGGQAGGLQR